MKRKRIIIIGVIALAILVIVFLLFRNGKKELILNTAEVKEETLQQTVTATGYIQPVDKIDVGTQVSGVIEKIYVDFNSQVKKGELLAELDKSTLNEKVSQAKASLASAQSDLVYAQQSYDRTKQLYDAKAATKADYEGVENKLTQAKTALVNAKANLHQAQVNLSYAEIYSPIDGIVLNKAVEQGQTVAASFNTPTLFTIANDLKNMQVEADVDEADIGSVRLGQKVSFTVDSYTDDIFTGTVKQIRLQPTVTSNVVTYTVIVEAPNPDEKLYPGMTANITIITNEVTGLCIPVEALKFSPSDEIRKHVHILPETQSKGQEEDQTIWVKVSEGITLKSVKTGLSDGIYSVITDGLKEGDIVVLSASLGKKVNKQNEAVSNPFMPKPPSRRGNRGGGSR